jgi:integrase
MAKVSFTAGRVSAFKCPPDKRQAFLWDTNAPGLGLRATPSGRPAYVFQAVYGGKDVRVTIGNPDAWSIPEAQAKARELQRVIDEGRDPRRVRAEQVAADSARRSSEKTRTVTVGEAWAVYVSDRKSAWGDRHYADHQRLAKEGGEVARSGKKLGPGGEKPKTVSGPIYPLLAIQLKDLSPQTIESWALEQGQSRPTSGRLAWRCLKAFLGWCAEHPDYAALVSGPNPAKTRRAREALGKAKPKQDSLQREQLRNWFEAVSAIKNPTIAAALQVMLLTGARPGEVLDLCWEDVNSKWKGLTIRDKVDGERVVPLTPYVAHLLASVPRRMTADKKTIPWVFSSASSEEGRLAWPRDKHVEACKAAGIEGLTLHGLRRSFKSLTEWLDIPAGVVAQLMGHKPSATAEKHYTVRPLDLLRVHHERIEAWILEQAGVKVSVKSEPSQLREVA